MPAFSNVIRNAISARCKRSCRVGQAKFTRCPLHALTGHTRQKHTSQIYHPRIARSRAQIKRFLGENIIVKETPDEIRLETEQGVGAVALLQVVGGNVNDGSGGPLLVI